MSEPLRFNGLHGRTHVRLVAAVGILASAAIATGGLVSLFSSEPPPKSESRPARALVDPAAAAADTTIELELRVREAELAAARARTALRDARQLGRDERELETYERRLEQLGTSAFESLRRSATNAAQLDQIRSFPTTIFIDKHDQVRGIYQGWSGPATGEAHKRLRERFETLIETMLREV
jgi:hypothetical protein